MFECNMEKRGDVHIARVIGKMTGGESGTFLATLQDTLPESGGKLVVDLAQSTYIGSQGYSLFIFLAESHTVKLAGASKFIRDSFRALKLDKLLLFYDTVELAVASFAAAAPPPPAAPPPLPGAGPRP